MKKNIVNIILIALCILFTMVLVKGQDSNSVWVKARDMSQYFRMKLDEEGKRHTLAVDSLRVVNIHNTAFIQGQMSVMQAIVDSVKVKK